MPSWEENEPALETAHRLALDFLAGAPSRQVAPADAERSIQSLDVELADDGVAAVRVLEELAAAVGPGLVASAGPRYFGFVIGGSLPAALGADWLASAWDQDAGLNVLGPAAAACEEIAGAWILDLLGLPGDASVGFVTGGQMANFTALAAARHAVLERAGWDVESDGLHGGPRVEVLVGEHAHVTIRTALRMLGLGESTARVVPADDSGRMLADALMRELQACEGPAIVCAQAGEVNTGCFDPLGAIADACEEAGAWFHVDGAFGAWAAASSRLRHLAAGIERADSCAVDAHKWLNVPYDCGLAIVSDPAALAGAMRVSAAYLKGSERRDPASFTPEASRRARGFAVYAALRSLGRSGVEHLVERCCEWAALMAEELRSEPGVEILNEVVLNQVLVGLDTGTRDAAEAIERVLERIQSEGTCWVGGTSWRGRPAIRVSFSNWSTGEEDVQRSAESIRAAIGAELAG